MLHRSDVIMSSIGVCVCAVVTLTESLINRNEFVNYQLFASVMSCRLCIELWDSFDACGVTSCGIWAGRRSPIGALQAERSVISKG